MCYRLLLDGFLSIQQPKYRRLRFVDIRRRVSKCSRLYNGEVSCPSMLFAFLRDLLAMGDSYMLWTLFACARRSVECVSALTKKEYYKKANKNFSEIKVCETLLHFAETKTNILYRTYLQYKSNLYSTCRRRWFCWQWFIFIRLYSGTVGSRSTRNSLTGFSRKLAGSMRSRNNLLSSGLPFPPSRVIWFTLWRFSTLRFGYNFVYYHLN